ncbi:hypothetical protein M942_24525 [Enterobacter ludwigii]|nr:hypothetical protein M942_24525 [Enterobacter ludwigii]
MNNEDINSALNLINSMYVLFKDSNNREEEKMSQLINVVRW